ncbi:MAG TPA: hypothetical protein VF131_07835 [Blastocatellia bacterium]|nr:hypothetical protein [Blastocatellia bacterium]
MPAKSAAPLKASFSSGSSRTNRLSLRKPTSFGGRPRFFFIELLYQQKIYKSSIIFLTYAFNVYTIIPVGSCLNLKELKAQVLLTPEPLLKTKTRLLA